MKRKSWIPPSAAAEYFSVSRSTVQAWISSGKLRAAKLPTGHFRILSRDVIKCLLELGRNIPRELGDLSNKRVLIVDPDRAAAAAMAGMLHKASGCKVSVAETAPDARGLLNAVQPDLIVLGIRHVGPLGDNGDSPDMLILARGSDQPAEATDDEISFSVSEILPVPVNDRTLACRVANVLLG